MATLFTRTAQNIPEEYNENDIETPDKYKELYDSIPMDVMGIILGYVPIVEFQWGRSFYPAGNLWNINFEWKGRYTYGFWHGSNVNICTKPDAITNFTYYDPNNTNFIFPCHTIQDTIWILENKSNTYITIQEGDVYNVYYASRQIRHLYSNNGIQWQIKVHPQLIINELQFIQETVTNHTQYKGTISLSQ